MDFNLSLSLLHASSPHPFCTPALPFPFVRQLPLSLFYGPLAPTESTAAPCSTYLASAAQPMFCIPARRLRIRWRSPGPEPRRSSPSWQRRASHGDQEVVRDSGDTGEQAKQRWARKTVALGCLPKTEAVRIATIAVAVGVRRGFVASLEQTLFARGKGGCSGMANTVLWF